MITFTQVLQVIADTVAAKLTQLTAQQALDEADSASKVSAAQTALTEAQAGLLAVQDATLREQLTALCAVALNDAIAAAQKQASTAANDITVLQAFGAQAQSLQPSDFGVVNADDPIAVDTVRGALSTFVNMRRTTVLDELSAQAQAMSASFNRMAQIVETYDFSGFE